MTTPFNHDGAFPAARLRRLRFRARLWVRTEELLAAIAPTAALAAAWLAVALLGGWALVPGSVATIILAIAASAGAALGWRGIARIRPRDDAATDRRLERGGGLVHQPLAVLADRPASDSMSAEDGALWRAHRQRAMADIPRLRAGWPRPPLPIAALLAVSLVLISGSGLVAGRAGPGRVWAALTPLGGTVPPTQLQAWIVPPRTANLGPVFLDPANAAPVMVPLGAHLTVAVVGGTRPALRFGDGAVRFQLLDQHNFQADVLLHASGRLVVMQHGQRLAAWQLNVTADQPPVVRLAGPAAFAGGHAMVPWAASDDYGLTAVTARLSLMARPADPPLLLNQPLDAAPKAARGAALPDLTAHPWAGLPVRLEYGATDTAGQHGFSGTMVLVLPARRFANPIAATLIRIRRGLTLNPAGTAAAGAALDQLSVAAVHRLGFGDWLNLRAIAALMTEQPGGLAAIQARIWRVAVQIEDGGVTDARARLADARAALARALSGPADAGRQARIEALAAQVQGRLGQLMQAMQRQAQRNQQSMPQDQAGREVDAGQLAQMAQQIQQDARSGRLGEAEAELRALSKLLDNLRPGSPAQAGQTGDAQSGESSEMGALLRDQAILRDHADSRLAQPGGPRAGNALEPDPNEPAGQPAPAAQRNRDAAAQLALRQRLGDLAQRLGDRTGQVPDALAHADMAMRDAARALKAGHDHAARADQQAAMDGLGQGREQMARQQVGTAPAGSDPLGRPVAQDGAAGTDPDPSDDAILPGGGTVPQSRALRDELRRRAADRTRAPDELNYIGRLLRPD